jgi:hypothetical protein
MGQQQLFNFWKMTLFESMECLDLFLWTMEGNGQKHLMSCVTTMG